jgi:signal transduction histidine kinase
MGEPGAVHCDRPRLEQVLSNLLGNAIQHGSADAPIEVVLDFSADTFNLSVRNQGAPVPHSVRDRLFQPFYRAAPGRRGGGLGLGLYIVAEVAKAHGGSANVTSSATGDTCFTVRVPRTSTGGSAHPAPAQERAVTLH